MLYSHTNKLVRFYDGLDGLKTGYTKEAGYCITSTAKRGDTRLITVVMGEPDTKTRNKETTSLLDYGFSQYATEKLLDKGTEVGTLSIEKGKKNTVKLVPMNDVTLLNKKIGKKKNASYELKVSARKAPVKVGDKVGELIVKVDGEKDRVIPITVKENVKKANLLELYLNHIKSMFAGQIEI